MSNQIVECGPCYELKYDETADCLRDQTFAELKVSYGKGSKLQCGCWGHNRGYRADQSFIAHMKSHKHTNWREEQQKDHKQKYGHCISTEKIVETLRKELREYKKSHANSAEIISKKDEKLSLLSKKLDDMTVENDLLRAEIEESQKDPEDEKDNADFTAEFYDLKMTNEILQGELEEYQNDLIAMTKAKDKLQHEVNSRKLAGSGKKRTEQFEQRQPFR